MGRLLFGVLCVWLCVVCECAYIHRTLSPHTTGRDFEEALTDDYDPKVMSGLSAAGLSGGGSSNRFLGRGEGNLPMDIGMGGLLGGVLGAAFSQRAPPVVLRNRNKGVDPNAIVTSTPLQVTGEPGDEPDDDFVSRGSHKKRSAASDDRPSVISTVIEGKPRMISTHSDDISNRPELVSIVTGEEMVLGDPKQGLLGKRRAQEANEKHAVQDIRMTFENDVDGEIEITKHAVDLHVDEDISFSLSDSICTRVGKDMVVVTTGEGQEEHVIKAKPAVIEKLMTAFQKSLPEKGTGVEDSTLSLREVKHMIMELSGHEGGIPFEHFLPNSPDRDDIFSAVDSDGDDKVQLNEILLYMALHPESRELMMMPGSITLPGMFVLVVTEEGSFTIRALPDDDSLSIDGEDFDYETTPFVKVASNAFILGMENDLSPVYLADSEHVNTLRDLFTVTYPQRGSAFGDALLEAIDSTVTHVDLVVEMIQEYSALLTQADGPITHEFLLQTIPKYVPVLRQMDLNANDELDFAEFMMLVLNDDDASDDGEGDTEEIPLKSVGLHGVTELDAILTDSELQIGDDDFQFFNTPFTKVGSNAFVLDLDKKTDCGVVYLADPDLVSRLMELFPISYPSPASTLGHLVDELEITESQVKIQAIQFFSKVQGGPLTKAGVEALAPGGFDRVNVEDDEQVDWAEFLLMVFTKPHGHPRPASEHLTPSLSHDVGLSRRSSSVDGSVITMTHVGASVDSEISLSVSETGVTVDDEPKISFEKTEFYKIASNCFALMDPDYELTDFFLTDPKIVDQLGQKFEVFLLPEEFEDMVNHMTTTGDQIREIANEFSEMLKRHDANGITEEILIAELGAGEAEDVFRILDGNENGVLDLPEYVIGLLMITPHERPEGDLERTMVDENLVHENRPVTMYSQDGTLFVECMDKDGFAEYSLSDDHFLRLSKTLFLLSKADGTRWSLYTWHEEVVDTIMNHFEEPMPPLAMSKARPLHFTKQQVFSLAKSFQPANGVSLTRDELEDMHLSLSIDTARSVFDAMDLNSDGEIQFDEFVLIHATAV